MSGPRQIPVADFHAQMRAQGVVGREHVAFKCPMCGTVQSVAMFCRVAKVDQEDAETVVGYSCIGRWLNAGPWTEDPAGQAKREQPGCDWTLGGLFRIHKVEVITDDGPRMAFELATPEEARDLQARLAQAPAGGTP